MKSNHFLITRFNLRNKSWDRDKNGNTVLDEDWLAQRNILFKKFCLPAVIGQSSKEFKWLIFFERGTEAQLKDLVEILSHYEFIKSIFVDGYDGFQQNLSKVIIKEVTGNPNFIITTRLDNDDSIHKDFIKEIQTAAFRSPVNNTVLHFPDGLCLSIDKVPQLGLQHFPLNQFLSLIETDLTNFKTVYIREHTKWDKEFLIVSITKKFLWLTVSHSKNKINRFKGQLVQKKYLNGFGIEISDFPWYYDFSVCLFNLPFFPKKDFGKYFVKKIRMKFRTMF